MAPNVLSRAESGTLGRGEQDLLVKFERQLPGFGGVYIANGAVRVYMKGNTTPLAAVRAVLSKAYLAHPNAGIRKAMANVNSASVVQGRYALSELIAIQKAIEARVPGWNGVGTNFMENKVVVAFPDSAAMESALSAMEGAGIPTDALTSIIMPPVRATTTYFTSYVRPTRAGVLIELSNDTYRPHTTINKNGILVPYYYYIGCSLGYNVNTAYGDYFMTASHCANSWRGQNGMVGDSVFQSDRGALSVLAS
jgi:hypothetical protein